MITLATPRLSILEFSSDDAEFVLQLLNEEQFKQNIGDRKVEDINAAREYILKGPQCSYLAHGFGLFKVSLNNSLNSSLSMSSSESINNPQQNSAKKRARPIGMCGLIKREELANPDLGFALLKEHCQNGFAYEASIAVLEFARQKLGLAQVWAITNPDNIASQGLLNKLGFEQIDSINLPEIEQKQLLYSIDLESK